MSHLFAFTLCLSGFLALALATRRQQEEVFGRSLAPAVSAGLRIAGWITLLLALVWLVWLRGWGMGLVVYSGHTSFAAALIFIGLIVHARRKSTSRN